MLSFKQFLLLLEDRIDFLKNQFQGKLNTDHDTLAQHRNSNDIIDHFATHADPSHNKMYTNWILNQYQRGNIRQENHPRIHSVLSNFHRYKNRLANKNITDYGHINDLEKALEPHLGKAASKKEENRQIKAEGTDFLHGENDVGVWHLKNEESACKYGKNTKWCTAADHNNKFNEYNTTSPIYFIKGRNENNEIKKYQFHPESGQFMDEKNEYIDVKDFVKRNPELKNVSELAGTHDELPMTSEHLQKLKSTFEDKLRTGEHLVYHIDRAKKYGYWDKNRHLDMAKEGLSKKLESGGIYSDIIEDAKKQGYWDQEQHLPKAQIGFEKSLDNKNFEGKTVLSAKRHGYWNKKKHLNKAKIGFGKKLEYGNFTGADVYHAKKDGYWNDEEHIPLAKQGFSSNITSDNVDEYEVGEAKRHEYFDDEEHLPKLKKWFSKKIDNNDVDYFDVLDARDHGYYDKKKHEAKLRALNNKDINYSLDHMNS